MGNRSRRRRRSDGSLSIARHVPPIPAEGSRNDPLYGIPDTNMPGLASIRFGRAIQGQRGWRVTIALSGLALLAIVIVIVRIAQALV